MVREPIPGGSWSGREGVEFEFGGHLPGAGDVDALGANDDVETDVAAAFGPLVVLAARNSLRIRRVKRPGLRAAEWVTVRRCRCLA